MDHVGVLKETDHVKNRIDFANIGQKLVAKSFTLSRPFHETGDIHKAAGCRNGFLGLEEFGQAGQARIRHCHDANIRLNCRKRVI